jgi:hypothetical protein
VLLVDRGSDDVAAYAEAMDALVEVPAMPDSKI